MVNHILKDGTELDDITGYVVSMENNPIVYEILGRIQGGCYEKSNGKDVKCNS